MRALPDFSLSRLRVKFAGKARAVDLEVAEDARQVVGAGVEQLHQKVLDLDVVVGSREAESRGVFHCAAHGVIQFADQRFQIHAHGRYLLRPLATVPRRWVFAETLPEGARS